MRSARWTLWTLALTASVAYADEPTPPVPAPPGVPPGDAPAVPPTPDSPPVPVEPGVAAPVEGPADVAPPGNPALAAIPAGPGIGGLVVDANTGAPIEKAFVFAGDQEGLTGPDGVFVLDLPPGEYETSVSAAGYSGTGLAFTVTDARVIVKFELAPKPNNADDTIVVVGRKNRESTAVLLEERREAGTATEAIGAEQMARAGDSDAGAAVRRVTGVSLVGGRYVYIRGLGERYSATVLNNAMLPSPEPDRRVVPLDLFPTALMSSLVIQKTYSPDMPGDFGGGVIQLTTKDVPDSPIFKASLSGDWNQGSTFQRHVWGPVGKTDWLGIDGGFRRLPDGVAAASKDGAISEGDRFNPGLSAEDLETYGESMPNHWNISDGAGGTSLPPNVGFQIMGGNSAAVGGGRLGYLAGLVYSHNVDFDAVHRNLFVLGTGDELTSFGEYDFAVTTRNVQLGGMINLAAQLGANHRIVATSLLVRDTDDEKRIVDGFSADTLSDVRTQRSRWVERMLWFNQLTGHDELPGLGGVAIDWRYGYSRATRLEPDRREVRYDFIEPSDAFLFSGRSDGNEIFYQNLADATHNPAADLTFPFKLAGRDAKVKVGGSAVIRDRQVDTRRYFYRLQGGFPAGDLTKPPQDIFTADNIGDNSLEFSEYTRPSDNYSGLQRLQAGYALFDLPILDALRFYGGARVEHNYQEVTTYELFATEGFEAKASIDNLDVLPGANLTYSFSDQMQVRAAYGRTVARPELREMSPSEYNDVTGGRTVVGNPDLKRTSIDNFDLRWEWYPAEEENVTISAFYKRFQDPIEVVIVPSSGQIITFQNAEKATNLGLEFDFRKQLTFVEGLYAGGNVALITSTITLPEGGTQTNDKRALQGQSPYLINVEVGYETPGDVSTLVAVLYNVNGRRISQVGDLGIPDIYDQPVHQLDAVVRQEFGSGLSLSIRGRNLLNYAIVQKQGDKIATKWREGVSAAVSLSWAPEL